VTHRDAAVLNHIGITVPDVRAAVEWYERVFGLRCIMRPRVLRGDAAATAETRSLFGPEFRVAYQAQLLTEGGAGLELFEFVDPPEEPPRDGLGHLTPGPWHVCLTEPDVAGAARRIVAAGGRQLAPVSDFVPGRPYQLVYCSDPWGTVLEIMSHGYAEVFSGWPQPGMQEETEYL
jgi:catechol 2,3-dioxygenase-like lactoylglutathione lyase family enzyme